MSRDSISALIEQALNSNLLSLADALTRQTAWPMDSIAPHKYPPTNISKTGEHSWLIELAVAGFSKDDLKVTLQKDNVLEVSGSLADERQAKDVQYIRRGIGLRSFTEQYALAENARVGDISLVDGLLKISIERDPPKLPEPKVLKITNG